MVFSTLVGDGNKHSFLTVVPYRRSLAASFAARGVARCAARRPRTPTTVLTRAEHSEYRRLAANTPAGTLRALDFVVA